MKGRGEGGGEQILGISYSLISVIHIFVVHMFMIHLKFLKIRFSGF